MSDDDYTNMMARVKRLVTDPGPMTAEDVEAYIDAVLADPKIRVRELARGAVRNWVEMEHRSLVRGIERAAVKAKPLPKSTYQGSLAQAKRAQNPTPEMRELLRQYDIDEGLRIQSLMSGIREVTENFAAKLKMEWNAELLAASFALGDGRTVTWGDASIADHERRIAMLEKGAAGNLETASRHRLAVTELQASGADCLAGIAAVAA